VNFTIDLSPTDIAAWWGALIASALLVWDVYKWRNRGANIRLVVAPNMQLLNVPGIPKEDLFISVTAYNTGSLPSTITNLHSIHYKSLLHKLFRRHNAAFVVVNPGFGPGIPSVVQPGGQWQGGIKQSELMANPGRTGCLYCGVSVSTSKKGIMKRVHLPKNDAT
jgi:hypothetical protein